MPNELCSCAVAALVKATFGWNAVNGDTGSKTLMGRRKRSAVWAESSRIRPVGARWRQKRLRAGRKRERRPAGRVRDRGEGEPLERRLASLPIAGRTWACMRAGRLCGLFPLRGPGGLSPFPFSVASRSRPAVSGLPRLGGLSCRQAGLPCPRLRSQAFFHARQGWLRGYPSAVPAETEYPSAGFAAPCF